MKRKLILAAFAVVAMASCSKTEISGSVSDASSTESGTPIEVSTFVDRTTKGAVGDQYTLQTDGFNVIAFENQSTTAVWTNGTTNPVETIMGKESSTTTDVPYFVEYITAGTWSYVDDSAGQTLVYWNNNFPVSFFAYSPISQETASTIIPEFSTNTILPTITFTTEEIIENQIDLLAYSDMNRTNNGNPVSFNFNHVLSKIGFTVTSNLQTDGTAVAITDITVTVDDTRIYNATLDPETDGEMKYKSGLYLNQCGIFTFSDATGTTNASWNTWDQDSDAEDKSTDKALSDAALVIDANSIMDTDRLFDFNTSTGASDTSTPDSFYLAKGDTETYNIMKDDAYLMIIPQELEAGDIISVTVSYKYIPSGGTVVAELLTKKVYIPIIEYQMGKQYTYNIQVGQDAIVFDSTIGVTNWTDAYSDQTSGNLDLQ